MKGKVSDSYGKSTATHLGLTSDSHCPLPMKKSHHALPRSHLPGSCKADHKVHGCSVERRPWQVKWMIITASDLANMRWEIRLLHKHPVLYQDMSILAGLWKRKKAHIHTLASQATAYKSHVMWNRTRGRPEQLSKTPIPSTWLNLSTQAATELLTVMPTLNMHQRECHQRGYRGLIHCTWRLEWSLVDQHMQPRYVLQLLLSNQITILLWLEVV